MKRSAWLAGLLSAIVATVLAVVGIGHSAGAATGPIFTVMNTSETLPDGVYFRNSPHWNDTNRVYGLGVFMNEQVQLECYAWGDAIGPYSNTLWYYVLNVTRPVNYDGETNQGFLNAHYINDGQPANVIDAGVPACVNNAPPPQPAPTYINGVNVGYPLNDPHEWGLGCTVQDFDGGTYGHVIVGYSNGTQIVRNGMLAGWIDNGGGPGFGCPDSQEYAYVDGVRQNFTAGSLYWTAGMGDAKKVTWYEASSPNWAGYTAVGSSITYATGTWKVPSVGCGPNGGYAVIWVGIDGATDQKHLIQAGSQAYCKNGSAKPVYTVWRETDPHKPSTNVKVASVSPGQTVQVIISDSRSTGKSTVIMLVNGKTVISQAFSTAESDTSGECIVEAPILQGGAYSPLLNFGTATFTSCKVKTASASGPVDIVDANLLGQDVARDTMTSPTGTGLRTQTNLPLGGAFSVRWLAP